MRIYERMASALIGTPLERAAEGLRDLSKLPKQWRHPGLREVFLEGRRSREVYSAAVKDPMNCIDIGCHLGGVLHQFVVLSPHGHHIAVEPIPYKAQWLRKKFPNVDVHQAALGDSEGTVKFFIDTEKSGFSGLRPHRPDHATQTLEVQCKKLDDIVPRGLPIGFMKIDVEGCEYRVFQGATRILTEDRPVMLFECTRTGLQSFDFTARQVFSFLTADAGYKIFLLKDWLARGTPLDLAGFEKSMFYPFQAFNYVADPGRK